MNTAKTKKTATPAPAALRKLGQLMTSPPKITPVGVNTVDDIKGKWTVSTYHAPSAHYRAVTDWLKLPEALDAYNREVNLYLVELDHLAEEAGVKS
jgi:hypothetical protein